MREIVDERLHSYKENLNAYPLQEDKICSAIIASRQAFEKAQEKDQISYIQFLWQQASYIRKSCWLFQFLLLLAAGIALQLSQGGQLLQRNMGVLASTFVIIMIPELWKNQVHGTMEIEGAAYYTLRQIYAARMCVFAMVDVLFLSIFSSIVCITTRLTIWEVLVQFLLPFAVNCCICCRILCNKRLDQESFAVALSILWAGVWSLVICQDDIYNAISLTVWKFILAISILYLLYCIRKVLQKCSNYWEVNPSWN